MSDTTALGYTPAFKFTSNGVDLTGVFADRLLSLRSESVDGGGEADKVEILIDNRGGLVAVPSVGDSTSKLSVAMGYAETGLVDQGTFALNEVGFVFSPFSLRFVATSVGMNTQLKAPAAIARAGQTVAEVIDSIAQTAGFTSAVDPSIGSQVIPFLNQFSSSGQLLNWLERQYYGMAKFTDGVLSFTQRGFGTNVSGSTAPVAELDAADFGSGEIKINSRNMYSKVRASYWDKINHQTAWVENTNGSAGTSPVPYWLKLSYPSKEEAQAAANAKMAELRQGIARGNVVLAKGDPSIKGGYLVSITGLGDGGDGRYSVVRATHLMTKDAGLITTLDLCSINTGDGGDEPTPLTTQPDSGGIGSA